MAPYIAVHMGSYSVWFGVTYAYCLQKVQTHMTSFPELSSKDSSSSSANIHCGPNDLKSVQKKLV